MGHGHYNNFTRTISRTFWRTRPPLLGSRGPSRGFETGTWGAWTPRVAGPSWQLAPSHRPPFIEFRGNFNGPRFVLRASSGYGGPFGYQSRSFAASRGRGNSYIGDHDMKRTHEGSFTPMQARNQDLQPSFRGRGASYGASSRVRAEDQLPRIGENRTDGCGQEVCNEAPPQEDPDEYSGPSEEELKDLIAESRKWVPTPFAEVHKECSLPGLSFSVMSYNILAQQLLDQNVHLYKRSPQLALSWEYRKKHLLRELEEANADIVCLQEVDETTFYQELEPVLTRKGYHGEYKRRTGGKKDGCAIFFKENVFVLEDLAGIEYRKRYGILDRDNIALLMLLRPRDKTKCKSKICVATTHLLFNPGRGDIKLAQLLLLLAEVDKYAFREMKDDQRPVYYPVIVCGDMNSEPHSPLYNFLSTGHLTYEGLTAGHISGQKEGQFRGLFSLEKKLVPPEIQVSDQCQYVDLQLARTREFYFKHDMKVNSSDVFVVDGTSMRVSDLNASFESGSMSHELNLLSAYKYNMMKKQDEREVTTHHSKASCMVDYIFYSVDGKVSVADKVCGGVAHSDVEEGELKLLSTYKLLNGKEMAALGGLPNAVQPSDHLPLVASFLLQDR